MIRIPDCCGDCVASTPCGWDSGAVVGLFEKEELPIGIEKRRNL